MRWRARTIVQQQIRLRASRSLQLHKQICLVALGAAAIGLGCQDSSGPKPSSGIRFVAGAGQTDTANAILPQLVIIEVRDSSAAIAAGEGVRFEALSPSGSSCLSVPPSCSVVLFDSTGFGSVLTKPSDGRGRASVSVQLSRRPGRGALLVTAPRLGLQDTAFFTIMVASPAAVVAIPKDTALYIGGTFTPRGAVTDRYGNARPDPVTYTGLSAAATVDGSNQLTGRAIGRAAYLVQGSGFTDTGWVSVVPSGTFAAVGANGLAVMNLDGSGYKPLAPSNSYYNGYGSWANPPDALAFDSGGSNKLAIVDLNGQVRLVLAAGDSGIVLQVWPSFSRDGSWIYFQGDSWIWKVHSDGTGLTRVSPPASFGEVDRWATPSPDGTRLVFATSRGSPTPGLAIARLDLGTGLLTSLGVYGVSPRWSPVADTIAYLDVDGRIKVLQADGTGLRSITPAGRAFDIGLDWSTDGQWILARDAYAINLIRVATGVILPLGYTTAMSVPVWRP